MVVIYLNSLNDIMKMKAARYYYNQEFDSVPASSLMNLIVVYAIDFVWIVQKHKPRILNTFDEAKMMSITYQHKELASSVARKRQLQATLEKVVKKSFNQAWHHVVHCFESLRWFAASLDFVMPTTSRVEADFSFMNYCKDDYNSNLSDYSLEGVMFARQLKQLDSLIACIYD